MKRKFQRKNSISLTLAEQCTGLSSEWVETITETQFPTAGVVEVRCSNPSALNTGSSTVTCVSGVEYTFWKKPDCVSKLLVNEGKT